MVAKPLQVLAPQPGSGQVKKAPGILISLLLGAVAGEGASRCWLQQVEVSGDLSSRRCLEEEKEKRRPAQVSQVWLVTAEGEKFRFKVDFIRAIHIHSGIIKQIHKQLFAKMANELAAIRDALAEIVQSQQGSHVKCPEVFEPGTRESKLKLWQDWSFAIKDYVKTVDRRCSRT